MLDTPIISIIIPVYNAESVLSRCIESVMCQSFDQFEVILVDDGSSDNSSTICDKFAALDHRVKVIHQQNKGVSSARNAGLSIAQGEWIAFVDSDDEVRCDYLKNLYDGVIKGGLTTLIIQGLSYVDAAGSEYSKVDFTAKTYSKKEFPELINNLRVYQYGFPFAKLYNRATLDRNNIRFDESISSSEDMLFMLEYLCVSDFVSVISGTQYKYYLQTTGTLSSRLNSYDSENRMFIRLKTLVDKNSDAWGVTDSSNIYTVVSRFLYRSILACYYRTHRKPRSERLTILRSICKDHQMSIESLNSPLLNHRIIRFCIKHRLTVLLDCALCFLIRH